VTRLGAIFAGGKATRFGSDKAVAQLDGLSLIDHVIGRIGPQCDAIIICGRAHGKYISLPDRPFPSEGPLSGLNAALRYAAEQGFDEILSVACDNADLPVDLADQLGLAPSYVVEQPVIGLWPATMAPKLDDWIRMQNKRAMMAWIDECAARPVTLHEPIANINCPEDLELLAQSAGAKAEDNGKSAP
jgi:molybdopterin-guanine dinucleotide biosynthesis protein A